MSKLWNRVPGWCYKPLGQLAAALLVAGVLLGWGDFGGNKDNAVAAAALAQDTDPLDGGTDWLNTENPLKLSELRGRVVLLDFWTLC